MTCNLKYYDLSFLYDRPPLTSYQITLIKYKRIIDIIIEYASLLQISHKDCFIIFKGQILDNFENISNLNLENKSLLFVYNDKNNKKENKKNKSLIDLMNSILNTYSPNTTINNMENFIEDNINIVNNLMETNNINFNSVLQEEIEEELSIDEEFENHEDQELEDQEEYENENQREQESGNQENDSNDNLYQKYFQQMEDMKAMGFTDIFKNIEALIVTNGDIQLAVNYLIQSEE